MPIQLDANFLGQVATIQAAGANAAQANLSDAQRAWMLPAGFTGNPLDPAALSAGLDREALNALYPLVLSGDGSVGDEMACRVQADYLSAQERALRLRHATSVRCQVHAAARRTGHAHAAGPVGRVGAYVQDLVISGAAP